MTIAPFYKLLFVTKPAFIYGSSLHNIFIDNDEVWNNIVQLFGNPDGRDLRNELFYVTYNTDTYKYELCRVVDGDPQVLELGDLTDTELFRLVSSKIEEGLL